MAHASIWIKYGSKVTPHGLEWKMEFKRMILPFLHPNYFPEDILSALAKHMILPKASTFRDVDLSAILRIVRLTLFNKGCRSFPEIIGLEALCETVYFIL